MNAMSPSEQPQITVLAQRRWPSVRVTTVRTTAGRFVNPRMPETLLLFHVGAPASVSAQYDGARRDRVVQRGEFDLVPRGAFACWNDHDPTMGLNLYLSQPLIEATASGMRRAGAGELDPQISVADARLFGAAQLIRAEAEAPWADELFAESLAAAVAVRLLERCGLTDGVRPGAGLGRRQLRRVVEHIEANLAGDLRLTTLAGLVGLSESHFRVLFREAVGAPVHRFVMDLRLERARELLAIGELSVAQVAAESGFCHQSHLARAMRRKWRIAPAQLQREARAGRSWRRAADLSEVAA
jgi:AraC family transcriptional regulator